MPVEPADHEITRRDLSRQDGASYVGVLVCRCGGGVKVGPYRSEALAGAALTAEWSFHVATFEDAPGST